MKMGCWIFLVVIFSNLYSSPVGNPAFPKLVQNGFFVPSDFCVDARVGYEGDFVSDARLKQYLGGSGRVDCFTQDVNSGTVTFNMMNRADVYGVLGASQFSADWRFEVLQGNTISVHRAQMETLSQFLWGLGGRAILFETKTLTLGIGGRYSRSKAKPVWLTVDAVNQGVGSAQCEWNEWQVDLDFAFQVDLFTPYVGVKYSIVHARVGPFPVAVAGNQSTVDSFKSRIPAGIVIGCSISNEKYFMLNVEARLVNEEAVTISGDLRF